MARRPWDITPTAAFWVVVVALFGFSAWFTTSVEIRRQALKTKRSQKLELKSGETLKLVKVIDGDEVSMQRGEDVFIVRLLGVKCFDAKVVEPGISEFGAACESAVRRALSGDRKVVLEYDVFKRDKAGRVLAYLRADERDVGEWIDDQGNAVIYTKYPFKRMTRYLAAQDRANSRAVGLWSSTKARERALALQAQWSRPK